MKIAMHTSPFRQFGLEETLKAVHELGYEAVELSANLSETTHFAAHSAGDREVGKLRALLDRFALQLIAIDIGGWDPPLCVSTLDEAGRKQAGRNVRHAIEVAGKLGCPLVTLHLWCHPDRGLWSPPGARDPEQEGLYRAAFKASVEDLCPVLDDLGVRMNFMPHPGGLIEESDPTVDLIRETGCPQVGYTYGIGHSFVIGLPGQDAKTMIDYAGDTLTHVLISDTNRVDRIIAPPEVKAHEHLVPGRGDVDFGGVLNALKGIGYEGYLSVHIISESDRILEAAGETRAKVEAMLE